MASIRVPAFAKVNLRLDVLGTRPDGYHELRTIFQSLTLHDALVIERTRGAGIVVECRGDAALAGELASKPARDNLVWRALAALKRELRLSGGIRATLTKRIPVARGLGGGSSDAAAALAGLARLAGRRVERERLLAIAAGLGADVPFFLLGGRALGTSRGDEIYPLADLPRRSVVVVSPRGIGVSTQDAYGWLDASRSPGGGRGRARPRDRHAQDAAQLTNPAALRKLRSFCALCWSPQESALSNDFEGPVFRRHPRLSRIRGELLQAGAVEAALAGSGSAVFGIFRNPAQARRAAQKFPEDRVFLCSTLSRRAYARALWGPRGAPLG